MIPILLAILFLAGGALVLGRARLLNVFSAENNAYAQNVIGQNLTPSADTIPVPGPDQVRPGLPNRYAEYILTTPVTVPFGTANTTITLTDKALFLDPAWHYASYPHPNDVAANQEWFQDYVAEDHPADLVTALGLQPSWTP